MYPFQVRLPPGPGTGLATESKGQAEQVRSIDVSRVTKRLGALSQPQLREIDEALRLHLGI